MTDLVVPLLMAMKNQFSQSVVNLLVDMAGGDQVTVFEAAKQLIGGYSVAIGSILARVALETRYRMCSRVAAIYVWA